MSGQRRNEAEEKGISTDAAIDGRARIHVAFHYVPERVAYLRQVVESCTRYRFSELVVVVDTNEPRGAEVVDSLRDRLDLPARVELGARIHADLEHPFLLTWAHRAAMAEHLGDHDVFLYTEDDILLPWSAIVAWHRDNAALYAAGWLRGFLRVELDGRERLVTTDLRSRGRPEIHRVGGRRFFVPYRPYQGFWIYDRAQMDRFLALPAWTDRGETSWIRENAAAGMQYDAPGGRPFGVAEATGAGGARPTPRVLIPMDERGEPAAEAFVHHLPNNIARRREGLGKSLPLVGEVTRTRVGAWWHRATADGAAPDWVREGRRPAL